jgi:CelD/BcsL family acetyltransferase involved in cellulose biosynthesis/glycosyltransferase involved in cell wall biosynthesis
MTLTVLNVAYPFAPVGLDAVGGAEQVLSMIDAALTRAGHRSLVVACGGSRVTGELIATTRLPERITADSRRRIQQQHREMIEAVLRRNSVDVIHLHGIDFPDYLPDTDVSLLATLHLPPAWYSPDAFRSDRRRLFLHCVSKSQQEFCPAGTKLLPPIENGVDLDRLRPACRKRDFAVALGRICPEKGFHWAIDAAKAAGVPLLLAGEVFPYDAHLRYFHEEIEPRLDTLRRFIGPVGVRRKRRLLAAACCLLVPSRATETSSLVTMEAFACGTPVIAFPSGALADLVEHGRTGFLVSDEREMAQALRSVDALDTNACRTVAEMRFSADRMTAEYLERYRQLAATPSPRRASRIAQSGPEVETITTFSRLEELRPAWRKLHELDRRATIFQSPEWLLAWRKHFNGGKLLTFATWKDDRLAGLAPMFVYPEGGERKLLFLGHGISDHLGVLVAPSHETEAAAALIAEVTRRSDEWDVAELSDLSDESPLLQPQFRDDLDTVRAASEVSPALRLPDGVSQLEEVIPERRWRKLLYYRRRLQRAGSAQFETANDETFEEHFDALLRLHESRWQQRAMPGMLADHSIREFHREVASSLLRRGWLRLYSLRLDGSLIASFYGFSDSRTTSYYLGGFAPEFRALSPGLLIVGHAIEQAVWEGSREFDFLRGSEPYKYEWGAEDRRSNRLTLRCNRAASGKHRPDAERPSVLVPALDEVQ